jgi:hypothetical protein
MATSSPSTSAATNLVAGDTNGVSDVFVRDRAAGTTERISVGLGGAQANGNSLGSSISADGRYVAYESLATNLVAGDTNANYDVFVYDRSNGTTTRASVSSAGAQGNAASLYTSLSPDGRYVGFNSIATNLVSGDTNGVRDVFVRPAAGHGARQGVRHGPAGQRPELLRALSNLGQVAVFDSEATNLVTGTPAGTPTCSCGMGADAGPSIWVPPQSRSVPIGATAVFTVVAEGAAPVTYQWRKGGVNLANGGHVSGATTASLSVGPVAQTDGGAYDCVVTDACGSATSAVAQLTVPRAALPTNNDGDIAPTPTSASSPALPEPLPLCGSADFNADGDRAPTRHRGFFRVPAETLPIR